MLALPSSTSSSFSSSWLFSTSANFSLDSLCCCEEKKEGQERTSERECKGKEGQSRRWRQRRRPRWSAILAHLFQQQQPLYRTIATSGSSLAAGFSSSFYYNCYCCFDYYCYFPHTFRILGLLHLKKAHRMLLLLLQLRPLLPSLSCFFLGPSFDVFVFSFLSRREKRVVWLVYSSFFLLFLSE